MSKSAAGASVGPLTLFYDGDCPLCVREVAFLKRRTPASRVEFVDIARPDFAPGDVGLAYETLMGQIHARLPSGELVTGVEVFRRLYDAAGLGWLAAWTRWPGLSWLADRAYALFARNRLRLTGRSGAACAEACRLPEAATPPAHARDRRLERRVLLDVPVENAFAFFCDPFNLEAITPPTLDFRIVRAPEPPLREGSEIEYALRLYGVPFRWHTRITDWRPDEGFVDEALSSPYAFWRHRHILRPVAGGRTEMIDRVDYRLPLGWLGDTLARALVRRQLAHIFDYRQDVILEHFGGRALSPDEVLAFDAPEDEHEPQRAVS